MNTLLIRAKALKLHGALANWSKIENTSWLPQLIQWEEDERKHRGHERRLLAAKLGRFKSLSQFDWQWPSACDREAIEELMQLEFLTSATNPIICGPNGVGKSTIACNIGYQAVLKGHSVLFTTAGNMLNDLAAQDGKMAFTRRLKHYEQQALLIIDELGYLSYSSRHADLLFEVISRRHEKRSTLVTTNKPFNEWGEIFPNASCVVSLIDRLVHHSEIISIEAPSFRLREAQEQASKRQLARKERRTKPKKNTEA